MLEEQQIKDILYFLEKYKWYFGFSDWRVTLDDKTDEESDSVAECDYDVLTKKMTVSLYQKYLDEDDFIETIIHELIHARIGVVQEKIQQRVENIKYYEEEDAVNDIARGFTALLKEQSVGRYEKKESNIVTTEEKQQ